MYARLNIYDIVHDCAGNHVFEVAQMNRKILNRHVERNRSNDAYDRGIAPKTLAPRKAKALKLDESQVSFNDRQDDNSQGGVRKSIKLAKDSMQMARAKMR